MITGLGIAVSAFSNNTKVVGDEMEHRLEAISLGKAKQVSEYFATIKEDLLFFSHLPLTLKATVDFTDAYAGVDGDKTKVLQSAFIYDNPNPTGQKYLLDRPNDSLMYGYVHEVYHPVFRSLMEARDYYDIFLFNAEGDLIYSVYKELDYATNFSANGDEWASSDLGKTFQQSVGLKEGEISIFDFAPYGPSANAPAAFVGAPIYKNDGNVAGVIAFQMPVGRIDAIMGGTAGLGETGETLLVGSDGFLRADSVRTEENDVLVTHINDELAKSALDGMKHQGTITDYGSYELFAISEPVDIPGLKWAVVAVQGTEEINAPIVAMRNVMIVVGAIMVLVAGLIGVAFAKSISKPISILTSTMRRLVTGEYDLEVAGKTKSNELGEMARAVEVFRENGLKVAELTRENEISSERRLKERSQMMQELQQAFGAVVDGATAGDFGKRVTAEFPDEELNALAAGINNLVETVDRGLSETGHVLSALAKTDLTKRVDGTYEGAFDKLKSDTNAVASNLTMIVGQLRGTSGALKTATGEILSGANDLSDRTTKQAATIEETSAAMEQLANTVMQNAERAKEARKHSQNVTNTAEQGGETMVQANTAMDQITESAAKISNIIGMIDDIAFQTNLLALNASVEAARAGEAGKGFAVVAIEVRRLAQSAAQASSEVKVLIEQSETEVSIGSKFVAEAAGQLTSMLEIARSSNKLIEQISIESQEQASSIDEVNMAVRQMDETTQHNAALVEETNAAIEQTESQANELDRIVGVFKIGRSAGIAPNRNVFVHQDADNAA